MSGAINMLVRPPRFQYTLQDLDGPQFMAGGKPCTRSDLELRNRRGFKLQCSFYEPQMRPPQLPCVIFLHGKGGSRVTARPAIHALLPMDICVFSFDFAGCGKSEGDYVTLGYWEREDVDAVMRYLKSTGRVSQVALWGRSMGAATTLLYCGDFQQNISCLVVDSPFHSLRILVIQWLREFKSIPGCLGRIAFWFANWRIGSLAGGANLYKCKPMAACPKITIPGLIAVANGDRFTKPPYVQTVHALYKGYKEYVEVPGDHDTERPPDFYQRIAQFIRTHISRGPALQTIDFDSQPLVQWDENARPMPRPGMQAKAKGEHPEMMGNPNMPQSMPTNQYPHPPNYPPNYPPNNAPNHPPNHPPNQQGDKNNLHPPQPNQGGNPTPSPSPQPRDNHHQNQGPHSRDQSPNAQHNKSPGPSPLDASISTQYPPPNNGAKPLLPREPIFGGDPRQMANPYGGGPGPYGQPPNQFGPRPTANYGMPPPNTFGPAPSTNFGPQQSFGGPQYPPPPTYH